MIVFNDIKLKGAFVIEPEKFEDQRGFFARSFSEKEFLERGLKAQFVEAVLLHEIGHFLGHHSIIILNSDERNFFSCLGFVLWRRGVRLFWIVTHRL